LEDVYRSPEDVPGDWRTPAGVQRTCQEIGERLQQSRGCARRLEDVSSSPEDVPGDWRTSPAVQRTGPRDQGTSQEARGRGRRPDGEPRGPEDTPFGGQRTYTEDVLAYMYDAILQA